MWLWAAKWLWLVDATISRLFVIPRHLLLCMTICKMHWQQLELIYTVNRPRGVMEKLEYNSVDKLGTLSDSVKKRLQSKLLSISLLKGKAPWAKIQNCGCNRYCKKNCANNLQNDRLRFTNAELPSSHHILFIGAHKYNNVLITSGAKSGIFHFFLIEFKVYLWMPCGQRYIYFGFTTWASMRR